MRGDDIDPGAMTRARERLSDEEHLNCDALRVGTRALWPRPPLDGRAASLALRDGAHRATTF